jgi:hypothetical protein
VDEDPEMSERMRQTFQEVLRVFTENLSFDEALAAVRRNRVKLQNYPPDGHFAQIATLDELTSDSEVERRRDVLCTVDDVVDVNKTPKVAIFFGSEHVAGPPHLRRAMEFIRDRHRFKVSEVPGLDEKGQRVLVRRLILEGLLRRVPASVRVAPLTPAPATPVSD